MASVGVCATIILAAALFLGAPSSPRAQGMEPRAYSNAPVGLNFLIAGYAYTRGGLEFDTAVPVTNAQLTTSSPILGYARVLDFWGKSAKLAVIVPFSGLSGTADFAGQPIEREVSGFADPLFKLSVNLYGAPALSLKEFAGYEQDLIVGASLRVTAPMGQYDDTKVVNLGTNRWSFKPEVGVSKGAGPVDAGGYCGGHPVHGQQGLLPWQHPLAGPALFAGGTCNLQLPVGHLGLARRYLFHRRPHDAQRHAGQ